MGYIESIKRKRPNGEYEYTGKFKATPWNAAGGRRGPSKVFGRWAAADSYIKRIEREMDGDYTTAGIDVTRQQRGIPRFADHVTDWAAGGIEDPELATLRGYQSQARQLAQQWPTQRVDEITPLMVRGYLTELRAAGLSPSTRTVRLTVLRHAMRAAIAAGHRPDDPTLGIRGPKPRQHQPRILTEPELMLMLVCLPGWLWPAALLSHDAGLRVGEICGLRMANLDLLHNTVNIADIIDVDGKLRNHPKSKLPRAVPLSARCVAALRAHIKAHPPAGKYGHVFANPRTRRQLTTGRVRDEWDKALVLAAIDGDKPTWHDLRHGCADALAQAGVDPWVIQAILGHANVATTQRYVRKANLARQAVAVDLVFGDDPATAAM